MSRQGMVAALAVVLVLVGARTADAALLSGTVKPVLSVTLSSPLVEGITSGDTQVLDTAGSVVCPLAQDLAAGTVVGDAACVLKALDFQFVTTWDGPNGPVARRHAAVVNVPTLLNVDGDLLPDVIGTLFVLGPTQFRLRVDRVLGEAAALPMRLEAIVDDPTGGALPREHIHAGFDARGSRTPVLWNTAATLPEDGDANLTTLDTTTTVTGAGPTIVTLGGLFDGDAAARTDPMGGRLRYTPVPPSASLGLSLGSYLEVRAGATSPALAEGEAEIVDGPAETRVDVDIANLPQSLRVRSLQPATDRRTVTYTASAPVGRLDAVYTGTLGGTLVTKAIVRARRLPLGMTLEQLSAKAATFSATSPLGSVEVGYGEGREPVLLAVDHPYARVVQDGTGKNSYAGRIDELLSASVDATDDIEAEYQLGPDGRKPLRALVEVPGLTIDGNVSDLPRHLKVRYAPDEGRIEYDAFTETIQQIDLEAVQSTPFFGRVTKIVGQIKDLPSQATVDVKPAARGFRLETNNPIGQAEVLLTSGPVIALAPGELGAEVEDVPSHFAATGRVQGLRLVDVTTGPGKRIDADVELASTPLVLRYEQADAEGDVDLDASLSAIPSRVGVTFDPDFGRVIYDANAGIDTIDATVTSSQPFFDRVTKVVGHVEDLPQEVTVLYRKPLGNGFRFSTTAEIGDASVLLTSGPSIALAPGTYGARIEDVPSHFAATARVKGLKLVDVARGPGRRVVAEAELDRTPLELDYTTAGAAGDLDLDASLSVIPSRLEVGFDPDDGILDYDANAGIDTIDATVSSSTPFFGRVKKIVGHVEDLPDNVQVTYKKPAGTSGFRFGTSEAIGDATVLLTSGPGAALNPGEYGADVEDIPSHYTAIARVKGLRLLDVTTGPGNRVLADARLASTPLALRYTTEDLDVDAALSAIPSELHLGLDPDAGIVDYDANAGIDTIDATVSSSTPFFGRVKKIVGHVEDLPDNVQVTYKKPAGTSGFRFGTSEAIGDATVLLTSGPGAALNPGEYGAEVVDVADRFTAVARVKGLRLVDVTTGPDKQVAAQVKLQSTPLVLRYTQPDVSVNASLSAIPDDVTLSFDPDAGTVDYAASAGIAAMDATVTSQDVLFGDIRRIAARVTGLPPAVAIGFKPPVGSGGSFNATPAVGMIEATLTDGATTVQPLAAGRSGVVMHAVGNAFALFGRLFNVSGANVTANGGTVEASLATTAGLLGPQDLELDLVFDDLGDAIDTPARIEGFVEDLPETLKLRHTTNQTTYEASSVVPLVTLNASNLPGGSADGGLHELRGELQDVPTAFTIVHNSLSNGIDANGPFSRIEIDAWDHGDQRDAIAGDGNEVRLDTRDGRLYVQTQVFDLQKVVLGGLSSTKIETAFGSDPGGLDVTVDGGTSEEPLDVDIDVTNLPQSSTLELKTTNETAIAWNASESGTDIDLKLASKDVGANLDITDLPSQVDVCIGTGIVGCDPVAPFQVLVDPCFGCDPTFVTFPNSFTLVSDANDTIKLDGTVCLPRTDEEGEERVGDVYDGCIDAPHDWRNRISLSDVRLKDIRFEFAAGDSVEMEGEDDPVEDDLLKLFVDSDRNGLLADGVIVDNEDSESRTVVRAGVSNGTPLRNEPAGEPFFGLFDLTPPPSVEDQGTYGQINCDDLSVIVELPVLGFTDVLPGLGEVFLGDICWDG